MNDELAAANKKVKFADTNTQLDSIPPDSDLDDESLTAKSFGLSQYVQTTTNYFLPTSRTVKKLIPGIYDIKFIQGTGLVFEKLNVKTDGLLRFPDTTSDEVILEIQKFWTRKAKYQEFGLLHRRGILLYGPPGSGKTSTIQIVMQDVIERSGVVFKFTEPGLFIEGIRKFREIQSDTPVVVLMEDIDSIIHYYAESDVLNILDGVDRVENIVFLATTNYANKLGERVMNRPSRFDRRYSMPHPNKKARTLYLKHLFEGSSAEEFEKDINIWVKDTERFSIAHIKELFVSVVVLGNTYKSAIEELKNMNETKPKEGGFKKTSGFGTGGDEDYDED